MGGRTKKLLKAAGVAAAATGLVVAAKRRSAGGATVLHVAVADEGWAVRAEGSERAESRHETKKEAVAAGRELARSRAPSRLVIHGVDGAIQRSHAYGAAD